jgi:hypothetical protein
MAFVGTPAQSLDVATDPSRLVDITTQTTKETSCQNPKKGDHSLVPCRNNCGHVYCSLECQQDDWEWGGHQELCAGRIEDLEHPLMKFKRHSIESNEIFLLIAQWLARIHKHDIPYHDDDRENTHPYTDFTMNPWWDVVALPLKHQPAAAAEAAELEEACKRLCEESHAFLQEAWPDHKDSRWLTPLGMARLIGSLEQNCVGGECKYLAFFSLVFGDLFLTPVLFRCLLEFSTSSTETCPESKYLTGHGIETLVSSTDHSVFRTCWYDW